MCGIPGACFAGFFPVSILGSMMQLSPPASLRSTSEMALVPGKASTTASSSFRLSNWPFSGRLSSCTTAKPPGCTTPISAGTECDSGPNTEGCGIFSAIFGHFKVSSSSLGIGLTQLPFSSTGRALPL